MTEENKGISRRTIVKGAAWSVPVIAAAVATPLASASHGGPHFDVAITGLCANDYDLGLLESIVGAGAVDLVSGLLSTVLGLDSGAVRQFTISAQEGTIPAGTTFRLSYPDGLIDVTILQGLLEAQALTVLTINSTSATFSLDNPITTGSPLVINLYRAIDVLVAGTVGLTLLDADQPSTSPEGADSASVSALAGASVNLQEALDPTGLAGVPEGTLTVQVCSL